MAFSIRYRIKGAGRLGKESIHPSWSLDSQPSSPPGLGTQEYSPQAPWAPIPSTSSHHRQSGGGGQGCQCQSLQGEQSRRLGQLHQPLLGMAITFPRSPWGKPWLLPKILSPEAHGNCQAFEGVGRSWISKTVVFNFSREDRAGNLDSWVPE